jgi:hypothetical protein
MDVVLVQYELFHFQCPLQKVNNTIHYSLMKTLITLISFVGLIYLMTEHWPIIEQGYK